ncbi:MAG: acetoin utilization protein AcuC [Candidatus Puniceispirillaceae bacterium]
MKKSYFFGSDIFRNSVYGQNHPLNIARVWPAIDICKAEGWLENHHYHQINPVPPDILSQFHDADYVQALWHAQQTQNLPDDLKDRYQIGRASNPIFQEVYSRPATAAHASYIAAQWLVSGKADVIYNPSGGTHHGRYDQANGFCFVNDPVIALQEMMRHTSKPIIYVDIDAHHCDGVSDWLSHHDQLLIISIHQQDLWPRTGQGDDRGMGQARNFPLSAGAGDAELITCLHEQILPLITAHKPAYLVVQAGADGHKDDPQSKLCYSLAGYWRAIRKLLEFDLPTLLLGGGGYNPVITAKAWAGNWALIQGQDPEKAGLSETSKNILRGLRWHHRLGRNPPQRWFSQLSDGEA